jgi:hypothetical protein
MPRRGDVQAPRRRCRRRRGTSRDAGKRRCRGLVVGLVVIVLVGWFVDVMTAGALGLPVVVGGLVLLKLATGMTSAVVVELDFLVEPRFETSDLDTTVTSFGSTGGFGLIVDVAGATLRISK